MWNSRAGMRYVEVKDLPPPPFVREMQQKMEMGIFPLFRTFNNR